MTFLQIKKYVHKYYRENDYNCAITSLKIYSKAFLKDISRQLYDAAIGMHGAGGAGAQCGLVEAGLLFIGIYGKSRGFDNAEIAGFCLQFAKEFEKEFSSLLCSQLRPEGFADDQAEHLCEDFTAKVIHWGISFIQLNINTKVK